MPTDEEANGNGSPAQQPPAQPLPPPVERNEESVNDDDEPNRDRIQETHVKPKHWTKYAEAFCAIALVLITWYYTRAAYRQAKASETAANAARDAVKVATNTLCETQRSNLIQEELSDANRISAERMAAESLNTTIANSNLDQRAWVAAMQIQGVPVLNQPFVISVTARNTGKTFAKRFRLTAVAEGRLNGKEPDFSRERHAKPESISLLAPNGDYVAKNLVSGEGSIPFLVNPNQTTLDNIKSGYYVQFAYGRMDYEDIFGQQHWTTYCFKLSRDNTWAGCHEHNDADDNGQSRVPMPTRMPVSPMAKVPPPCPVVKQN